jgi:hypothetical protein
MQLEIDLIHGPVLHEHGDVIDRIENLENRYEIIQIWQSVGSTPGSLVVPKLGGGNVDVSKYTVETDEWPSGIDAIITTIDGKPKEEFAYTAAGVIVTCALSGTGNRTYTLSATPSAYPVAVVYFIRIQSVYATEIDPDYILSREDAIEDFALETDAWWYALTL